MKKLLVCKSKLSLKTPLGFIVRLGRFFIKSLHPTTDLVVGIGSLTSKLKNAQNRKSNCWAFENNTRALW